MSTAHGPLDGGQWPATGGAAQRGAEQSSIESSIGGNIRLEAASTVKASDGNNVILSRSAELFITDEKGKDRARYRLQYGAKLFINDGELTKSTFPGNFSNINSIELLCAAEIKNLKLFFSLIKNCIFSIKF